MAQCPFCNGPAHPGKCNQVFVIQCITCPDVYSIWSTQELAEAELKRLRQFPDVEELPEARVKRSCAHASVVPWTIDRPEGFLEISPSWPWPMTTASPSQGAKQD